MWSRNQKSPRQTLTLERIVAEAVALLDEEGVGRLTMRRLAERLDTGSTTLYWHVKTKDDVLDLALDEVFREVRMDDLAELAGLPDEASGQGGEAGGTVVGDAVVGDAVIGGAVVGGAVAGGAVAEGIVAGGGGGDWRAPVRGLMRRWRAALLRHPWSATLLDRPLMGPNALRRTEFLYETLTAAGFAVPKTAAYSLSNYVMGSVIMQVTWERSGDSDTGAFLRERADRYPALAEHGLEHDWDATFDEGLGYLLEGMARSRA
uniref:Transcriptional regulator, TetR family n=1 Tax=Nonomuraea gerenzanensis TaxID=93944 RepID=A0A1M4E8V3_9ACTN|nr:Transcriptional regulator, TetR family [Nonomuraea gerenzanensis]